jgi:alpha-galactosidase
MSRHLKQYGWRYLIVDMQWYVRNPTSNDVWDIWNSSGDYPKGLADIFPLAALWAPEARAGAWPGADMLAIGYLGPAPGWGPARVSRLSDAEQRTLITLWCISRSPLMIGANLTRMNKGTRRLLTNPEVIDVDQHSTSARLAYHDGELLVWTATPDSATGKYIAVFKLGEAALSRAVPWARMGIETPVLSMRDLWLHQDLTPQHALEVGLAAHASNLYRVSMQ